MSTLSERLKAARKNKNMTQSKAIEMFNEQYGHVLDKPITYSYYRTLERSDKITKYTYHLAKFYEVSPVWLIEGIGEMNSQSPTPIEMIKIVVESVRTVNMTIKTLKPDADDEDRLGSYVMSISDRLGVPSSHSILLLK